MTVCTQERECLFGHVGVDRCVDPNDRCVDPQHKSSKMHFNAAGEKIDYWWSEIVNHFDGVELDVHQTMPNHLHGNIIILNNDGTHPAVGQGLAKTFDGHDIVKPTNGRTHRSAPTVGTIIQWFKTMTTNAYIDGVKNHGWPRFNKRLWQRNYYEHIIRDEDDLDRIRAYTITNPEYWDRDKNNPANPYARV